MEDVKTKQDLLIDSMNEDIKRLTDKKAGHPIGSGSDWEVPTVGVASMDHEPTQTRVNHDSLTSNIMHQC